jgi:hypothetical protein
MIHDNCIIFGGTLAIQRPEQHVSASPDASSIQPHESRVYFNDLLYLRFAAAGDTGTGTWVHQPKRSGELWPSARSGHAAAAGELPSYPD